MSDSAASATPAPAPNEQLLPTTRPAIQLVGLSKHFGDVVAVDGIDLAIDDGEFFSLLGPSGSGKTNRAPADRRVRGADRRSGAARRLRRHVEAALRPRPQHGVPGLRLVPPPRRAAQRRVRLKVKGVRRRSVAAAPASCSKRSACPGLPTGDPPSSAVGSASAPPSPAPLVNHPKVLLLDEPLGALDLKLREEMQVELKALQRDVGITFVFVTHDQGEALSMSNRAAVFNNGRLEQVGSPREVYESPQTTFVASFVGTSNILTRSSPSACSASMPPIRCDPSVSVSTGHRPATARCPSMGC